MSELRTFVDDTTGGEEYAAGDWTSFERNLVFVAMPLDGPGADEAFAAIGEACAALGLRAERLEREAGSGAIKRIAAMVRRAEFLIFDLTRQQPNVFYGLGYAHGVGNEALDILLVAQEGTVLDLSLAPLRVKTYGSPDDLRRLVADALAEMIQQTRR